MNITNHWEHYPRAWCNDGSLEEIVEEEAAAHDHYDEVARAEIVWDKPEALKLEECWKQLPLWFKKQLRNDVERKVVHNRGGDSNEKC